MRGSMLRGSTLVVTGVVATCLATLAAPPPAQARHGLGLFGILTAPLRAVVGFPSGHLARYSHHHHHAVARAPAHEERPNASASTTPAAEPPAPAAAATPATPAATAASTPSVWPNFHAAIYNDIVGYALWPREYADRFWSHGPADILDAILGPPAAAPAATTPEDRVAARRGRTRLAKAETTGTVGAAGPGVAVADDGICGASARDLAARPLDTVASTLQLADPQRAALDKLREALLQEIDTRHADCRSAPPATAVERLRAMKAGLWSVRNVGIYIRTPLKNFYDSLSGDQKTRFRADGPAPAEPHDGRSAAAARGAQQPTPAAICGSRAALAEWPTQAVEQSIEPTNDQRPSLERLRATYNALGKALMASCPTAAPMTPLERLDAADDRLLSLASATMTMNTALVDFYGRLTDDQKQRFNLLRR